MARQAAHVLAVWAPRVCLWAIYDKRPELRTHTHVFRVPSLAQATQTEQTEPLPGRT